MQTSLQLIASWNFEGFNSKARKTLLRIQWFKNRKKNAQVEEYPGLKYINQLIIKLGVELRCVTDFVTQTGAIRLATLLLEELPLQRDCACLLEEIRFGENGGVVLCCFVLRLRDNGLSCVNPLLRTQAQTVSFVCSYPRWRWKAYLRLHKVKKMLHMISFNFKLDPSP